MFGSDETPAAESPVDEQRRVPVQGADGWYFLPFEQLGESGDHRITLVGDDGVEMQMTLPSFLEQADELGEIALIVIRARERWRELKGLGA